MLGTLAPSIEKRTPACKSRGSSKNKAAAMVALPLARCQMRTLAAPTSRDPVCGDALASAAWTVPPHDGALLRKNSTLCAAADVPVLAAVSAMR
jgi:hypothetical protein